MAITNGYCSLAEAKQRLQDAATYTATTISFANATSKISDTAYGLKRFLTSDVIEVSGSTSNDGIYNVTTGNVAAEIVTTEALTDEVAGDTVTISLISNVAGHDIADDAIIESIVEAVSRVIDEITWRRFFASAETRYYTAQLSDALAIDDLISVTTLKTDRDGDRTYENTWASTDYDLMPFNAALESKPYTQVEITPNGDYSFPTIAKGVELAGSFGYAATAPDPIKEACLLGVERLMARQDTPLGVSAAAATGQLQVITTQLKADPDFMTLVQPYIRKW